MVDYKIRVYKEPHNLEDAKKYVCDAIDSSWICINGKYIDKCVEIFKRQLGVKHVILTDSGTSALHCCMKALKLKHPNISKLYVPNNVYVSVWNTALLVYPEKMIEALDCDVDTWNIDTSLIDNLEKNSAVVVVHNIGNIVNVPLLKRKRPDIVFIEDNCEGFPGLYEGKSSGSSCFVSTISFNMNKTVTSGHGGAFCTNDDEVYEHIYDFVRVGSTRRQKYIYQFAGYTYGFTNLQAALLYSQLTQLDDIMLRKKYVYKFYEKHLKHPKIKFQKCEENTVHSYWYFALRIVGNPSYDMFKEYMDKTGIETRPMFYHITCQPHLKNIKCVSDKNATLVNNECALLPCYSSITDEELNEVVRVVLSYVS